jgi:hypothetical protein
MKPGLEQVLQVVHEKRPYYFTNARPEFWDRAVKSTLENVRLYPEKYLKIDEERGKGENVLWRTLREAGNRARAEYFDFAQRELFPHERLYRKDQGFFVTTRDLGEPLPITGTLRETVATLRSVGLTVKWRNERMIDRYGHAARAIHHEIGEKARRLQNEEDFHAREYHQ